VGRSPGYGGPVQRSHSRRDRICRPGGTLVIYLDTSAFLKLYVREADSDRVQDLVIGQKEPLPVWEFQQVEMINASPS